MFKDFKLQRRLLSTYYIAVVFSFFIFKVIAPFVVNWVRDSARFLTENTNFNFVEEGKFWWFFIFFCFVITLFIRRFIVEPLGFFIDEDDDTWWENGILALLILGFYIYLLNQVFTFPMPSGFLPEWLIKVLGGYKNTYMAFTSKSEEELTWGWIPWLWYIGPIIFMYVRTKVEIKK